MFTGPDGVQYRWALGTMGMTYPKVSPFPTSVSSTLSADAEPRCEVGHHRWEENDNRQIPLGKFLQE